MQRLKLSGARSNARHWKEATNGPRIGFDGSYSNSSKRLITGAGSTALWGINHLWTSNKTTSKNAKARVNYCDHKKGGRENSVPPTTLRPRANADCPTEIRRLGAEGKFQEIELAKAIASRRSDRSLAGPKPWPSCQGVRNA